MVFPASILSMLMSNEEARQYFHGLAPKQQKQVLDTEFKSSTELYETITHLRDTNHP